MHTTFQLMKLRINQNMMLVARRQKIADELPKLHTEMKEKWILCTYSGNRKLLTFVPDSWFQKYCSKIFWFFRVVLVCYLVRTARELKKTSGIPATPLSKKGKKLPQEKVDLIVDFYKSDENTRQMLGKNGYVSIKKNHHEQNRLVLCNLHELYVAFK